MLTHETKIEVLGELRPALVEYELDGLECKDELLITAVILRHCIAERGDLRYMPDGDAYCVRFPIYEEVDIFKILNGKQLEVLADEIYFSLKEKEWDDVMINDRPVMKWNAPTNYPGVRI